MKTHLMSLILLFSLGALADSAVLKSIEITGAVKSVVVHQGPCDSSARGAAIKAMNEYNYLNALNIAKQAPACSAAAQSYNENHMTKFGIEDFKVINNSLSEIFTDHISPLKLNCQSGYVGFFMETCTVVLMK